MALNTFKCNYLTPLHFKGLNLLNTLLHFRINKFFWCKSWSRTNKKCKTVPQQHNETTASQLISCRNLHQIRHLVAASFGKTFPRVDRSHARWHQMQPTVESLPCSRWQWRAVPRPAGCGIDHSWSTSTILHWCKTNSNRSTDQY